MTSSTPVSKSQTTPEQRKARLEQRLRLILRLVGYGFIVSALIDVIAVFVPPNFTDPVWEFKVVGDLVERMPVPMMGIMLIFLGELTGRDRNKVHLKVLSWISLLVGIAFFMLIPLGLSATRRIDNQNNQQISVQVTQSISQIEQRRGQLKKAKPEDVDRFFTLLRSQGRLPNIKDSKQLQTNLFTELANAEKQVNDQAETTRRNLQTNLLKNSIKYVGGALLSGILFCLFWYFTTKKFTDKPTASRANTGTGKRESAAQVAASLNKDKDSEDDEDGVPAPN